jgi:hypothetical protein
MIYKFFKRYGWCMWGGFMMGELGIATATLLTWKALIFVLIFIILVDWYAGELERVFG